MYVLIIVTWLYGNTHGAIVTSVTDMPAESCREAADTVTRKMKAWGAGNDEVIAFCVEK